MDKISERTHTSRILTSMAHEFAVKARKEGVEGKIQCAKRVHETTADYLVWLHEQRQK